ncbi:hypothetical protein TruAng_002582 [Truncatella angustata]|nr:hypothetical protein TruAng_002582 [Truncatella angustata]
MDRHVFFAHKVMAICFTTTLENDTGDDGKPGSPGDAECEGDIDGAIILDHSVIKWRRGGKKARHFELSSEAERIKVLRDYFGIEIGIEEAAAMMGSAAQLANNGWGVFDDDMLYREAGAPTGSMPV